MAETLVPTIKITVSQPHLHIDGTVDGYPTQTAIITFGHWFKGDKGDDGKSSYEIWLEEGHTGTEEDFLEWLKADSVQSDWNQNDDTQLDFIKNKPTIPTVNDTTLTIQKNGTNVGTFTANSSQDKIINIRVPSTAADVNALPASTAYGASLSLTMNSSTYVLTARLKDQNGNNLGSAQTVDLPLESVVISGSYDSVNKKLVLTLQNGNTIDIPISDLINGLQSEITAQNPLSADLLTDGITNVVYTATEQSKLANIEAGAEVNVQSDWSQTDNTADDFIKNKPTNATTSSSGFMSAADKEKLDTLETIYVEKTYAQLSAMFSGGTLVKGQKYRITDYVTTTATANTSAAGHAFDLVVTATDTNKLDCIAQAVLHTGDTYFSTAGANLSNWQVWYDINNDTTKYAWADSTNGKGVIYRLIDEYGNDCPYDFKNILFTVTGQTANAYTFNIYSNSTCSDNSLNGRYCYGNVIKPYYARGVQTLNFNVFYNTSNTAQCYHNTFGYGCYSNTFGYGCYSNTFGNKCSSNTFGNECMNNTFGDYCYSNTFGNKCSDNTFGNECMNNTFGDYCSFNTFGNNCNHIIFGNSSNQGGTYCHYNIVENGNSYIRLYQTTGTAGTNNQLQNVYIAQGVNNTSTWLDISTIARNLSYRTTVAKLSNGTIRIYKEDEDDMLPSITGNSGKVLTVNSGATGTEWTTIIPGSTTLSGLTDTTITSVANGQLLQYNSTSSKWENANKPSYTAVEVGAIPTTDKGSNGGVAELDSNGKVPSSQLPSYVDDVLEYASLSNFPATGESGKIYIALDTNQTYRWSGSAYVEISPSLALGETASTAYRGDKGKANADAIAAIKDGTSIDSFGDVETALADKINKSSTAGLVKNDGTIDTNTYLTQHQDISDKADKVSNATNDNFAALDNNGNLKDSGSKASDFQTTINASHKLSADYIQDGTTNKVINVKPDWNAAAGNAAEILNKPNVSALIKITPTFDYNSTTTVGNKTTVPCTFDKTFAEVEALYNANNILSVDYYGTAVPLTSYSSSYITFSIVMGFSTLIFYITSNTLENRMEMEQVFPTPSSSDENKLLSVDSNGNYTLVTIVNSENIEY
jgi:hypothetical protein